MIGTAARWGAMVCILAAPASAQTSYYNLDSGRPTRIEDAVPTTLRELELQFLPVRGEWIGDGTQRFRFEPKVAYGILPLTEIEVRVPIVQVSAPNALSTAGVTSAGIGALHAFNVETSWPALAIAAEMVMPVGSLSAPIGSYAVKGLLTKTFSIARVQLNAGGGTWSVRNAPATVPAGYTCGNAPGIPPCLIPDVPCNVIPLDGSAAPSVACAPATLPNAGTAAPGSRSTGPHWTAALGVDHTFPLVSTLIVADVIVDRFAGLYPTDDWTAEIGLRRQVGLQLVLDLGMSRKFAGAAQSKSATIGLSYSIAWR
jgi:hypothetical protein